MKITEMLISALLKKRLCSDLKDVDIVVDLPNTTQKVHIQIDQITIKLIPEELYIKGE